MGRTAKAQGAALDAEAVAIGRLEQRVAEIEEALEGKAPSLRDRVKEWAAFVAVFISIATGAFTVYDRTVVRQRQEAAAAQQAFNDAIRSIQEINQNLQAQAASLGPAAVSQVVGLANAQKVDLVDRAETLMAKQPKLTVTGPAYVALANEKFNFGDMEKAIFYADRAARADGTVYLKGEALRIKAQVLAGQGASRMPEAREAFGQSLAMLQTLTNVGSSGARANLLGSWAIAEAYVGDCARAGELLGRFNTEVAREDVVDQGRRMLRETLRGQLQGQTRCALDLASLAPS